MQSSIIQSQLINLQNIPKYRARGSLQKREQEDSKNQMIREFVVRFCLLPLSEATPIKVTNMTI